MSNINVAYNNMSVNFIKLCDIFSLFNILNFNYKIRYFNTIFHIILLSIIITYLSKNTIIRLWTVLLL